MAPEPASRPVTGDPFPPLPVQGKDLCPPQDERGSVGGDAEFRDTFASSVGGPLARRDDASVTGANRE